MNEFTLLVQPLQSQVTVDPIAKECPSNGFNYPVFRQLNKKARLRLSQRFSPNAAVAYRLLAVSNSKGWFAAIQSSPRGCCLILSTLEDLRSAFLAAKDNEQSFSPKRTLPIPSANANIIVLTSGDTRLLVGLENGFLAVYDTATLFTSGTGNVSPLKMIQVQSSPLRQVLPNPGTEPNLSELFAVVSNGKVVLLNIQLEIQGGWEASDLMTQPISVAWSPKGKHISIGLQTGDILTFSLANKSNFNKHIPPTADAILVSLNWLGPGYTFRTSYAAQDAVPAKQHIITLDSKTSTATYVAPDHPFPAYDRTHQNAYVVNLPKWDEELPSSDEGKSLVIVGDFSSVDLEILGNIGTRRFRQSQDNPLTLPLDSAMDDTILLSLEVDLTDAVAGAPIVFAYLNDGSLQGWHAEHSKRYIGMLMPGALDSPQTSLPTQEPRDADMALENSAPMTPAVNPFPSFGLPTSTFGGGQQTSAFGKTGFGQIQGTSVFGQPSFSHPAFAAFASGPPLAFGLTSKPATETPKPPPSTGFTSFTPSTPSPFASATEASKPTTNATRTSVFGTALDGFSSPFSTLASDVKSNKTPAKPAAISPPSSPEPLNTIMTTTPSGPPPPAVGGAFENLQTTPSSFKPAAGFGAFGSTTPTDSPFFKKPDRTTPIISAFAPIGPSPSSIKTSNATTAFGSPSILGAAKSAFTPTTPATPTPNTTTTTPTTGDAFASFSGATSPFASFSASKKSFSDLLKVGDSRDPDKLSTKAEGIKAEGSKQPPPIRTSVFGTPKADEKEPISVFPPIAKDESATSADKGKSKAPAGADGSGLSLEDASLNLSNISLSTSSSYVDVDVPTSTKDAGEDEIQDTSDFLTEDELVDGEVSSEDGSVPEEESGEEEPTTPSPTVMPLPAPHSPSATPQPEVPKIELPADDNSSKSGAHEQSTTPPGSPKEVKPSYITPSPGPSPFGIGLGRPSTRPTRRSPLANAVVLVEEGETASTETEGGPSSSVKPPTLSVSAKNGTASLPTPPSVTPSTLGLSSPPPEVSTQKPLSAASFNFGLGSRPATAPPINTPPSLTSTFTVPTARAATVPATSPPLQTSLFSSRFTSVAGPTIPSFAFGAAASPAPLPTSAIKNGFGLPTITPPAMGMISKGFVAQPTPVQGLFGRGASQTPTQTPTSLPLVSKPMVTPSLPTMTEEEILEEGMQQECANLVKTLDKTMEELRSTAVNARHMLTTLNVSLGGSNQKADLGNPAKWGFADVERFGKVLLQYEQDLGLLQVNKEKERRALREIKNSILKAGTRREEIARFNKAKDDKDFAKLLKARSLGPEQSETQMQLRKRIGAIRGRVQNLERRLEDDKKRLAEAQLRKPRVKAPTLDTINRTYRNIGIAIEQQTDEVNRLATRISKLNIAGSAAPETNRSLRDFELPASQKPLNVAPNVAATTAAALNAERSAQRLKRALLTVRKVPLLNTKAVNATSVPLSSSLPGKPQTSASSTTKGLESLPLSSEPAPKAPVFDGGDLELPEDHFDPIGSHSNLGGSGSGRREKPKRSHRGGGSVARKSPAPESSASPEPSAAAAAIHSVANTGPVSFDWGPLPTFTNPSTPKGLPKSFVPISSSPSPSGSATINTLSSGPPTTLEPPKGLPKGFVSFSPTPSSPTTIPPPAPPTFSPVPLPKGFVSFTQKGTTSTPTLPTFSFAQQK